MKLSEKQLVIMEALARFKYLTSSQLKELFNMKSCNYINATIRKINVAKYPMIKSIDFGIIAGYGRLARVHHLTAAGANLLITELGYKAQQIQYPKNRNAYFQRDYFHRVATINFNIKFQKWVASNHFSLKFFHLYFNRSQQSNYKRSVTALSLGNKWIEPDGIGLFIAYGKPHLFLFEQHNGKDKQRAIRQMLNHIECLANGSFSDYYQIKSAAKIVYVFEYNSCKLAVIKEFSSHPGLMKFKDYFLFKSQFELNNDFHTGWHMSSGNQQNFLLPDIKQSNAQDDNLTA